MRPFIAHMHVFGCITYAMMPTEKIGKLNANDTKYLFLDYREGIKAYRLMYLET